LLFGKQSFVDEETISSDIIGNDTMMCTTNCTNLVIILRPSVLTYHRFQTFFFSKKKVLYCLQSCGNRAGVLG
jgi:hypothetical protein